MSVAPLSFSMHPAARVDLSAPAPHTTPPWVGDVTLPALQPLDGDLRADVCVVGAGIAGLSVAYVLARAGKTVAVLDDGPIGGGETARTTAHLSCVLDTRYVDLEHLHGRDRTPLIAESHGRAIETIESIIERERIACDFRRLDGYLFAAADGDPSALEAERAAAVRAGIRDVAWVDRAPHLPFDTRRCLRFPRQAQMHPLRYLGGLAEAVVRHEGRLVAAHATRISHDSAVVVETTSGHTVTATDVVVATNTPVNDRITIHTKQAPYRTYVIAAEIEAGSVPLALYWDTADPYHYVRVQSENEERHVLLVGGEDHFVGQADDGAIRFARLEAWAQARFPSLGRTLFRWSGQIMAAIDGIGFIGKNPGEEHVYVATGDSGSGLTHGTIAGLLIGDYILGRANPWAAVYEPGRITPRAALTFTRESLHVAAGYTRWFAGGWQSLGEIAPGCGAVLQRGLAKVAVYRDERGVLHERSAICPHLGGVVVWNDVEKSWDCPCHGSRFDTNGQVMHGPANTDLGEVS
jgi:glycine/D-amino acid oxidase-like deaminating enzyme/nitrite reductase/ring-hydroxylating ferredoxin subunit